MPTTTFKDLNDRLISANHRKEVLKMLIGHIENNFRSVGGQVPKNAIKMENGSIVPEAVFEAEVEELFESVHALDLRIKTIEESLLEPMQVVPAPVVPPAPAVQTEAPPAPAQQEVPAVAPKRRGRPRKEQVQ